MSDENSTGSGGVGRINLMSTARHHADPAATVFDPTVSSEPMGAAGMSMRQLAQNYDAILKARAIYYPVAYQFPRRLGRGRQGEVFLGLRQGARGCITEHAIKVYDPQLYRTPEEYWTDMGRIASQISKLQRVKSPGLLPRHSYEETYGIGYVQMDAIDGCDLGRLLERDHLELARGRCSDEEWSSLVRSVFRIERDMFSLQPGLVVYILRGVLRGLESLHASNFLHFDVKPANIMVDRLGTVRLIDFGRAVIVGERLRFLLGTPLYMAPEVHRREVCGFQSDLYSVGLIGLEMLRGEPLTRDKEITEDQLLALKLTIPDRLSDWLPPDVLVNKELVSIIRRLTDPDPQRRFPEAKEADVGDQGLKVVDRQLAQAGLDSEYSRDLADYIEKLVDPKTQRVELQDGLDLSSETTV